MSRVQFSNHSFDLIPSGLYEWGNFFLALKAELLDLINGGHIGHASVYLPEHNSLDCPLDQDELYDFRINFSFHDDSTSVYWAAETLGADAFTVNRDLSWTYDPDDMGKIGEPTPDFKAWLEYQESQAGKLAVLAIAVARAWLRNPPNQSSGMSFDVRGLWVD